MIGQINMPTWAFKIAAKLVLGRLPFRHSILRNIGIFKHGEMDDASYALKIFNLHRNNAFKDGLPSDFTAMELGPGDSLVSALIAKAYGSQTSYHVDVGSYATKNINKYKHLVSELRKSGLKNIPNLDNIDNITDLLDSCQAVYLTGGLSDLKSIPSETVDFIWSHSVLEHIRKKDFTQTMLELNRILKKTGKVSHNVDLQDHLERSLNNLRFPEWVWENDFFANSGFYTNRIRYGDSLKIMRKAGFRILKHESGKWENLPLSRKKLHSDFKGLDNDELCVRTYCVILDK